MKHVTPFLSYLEKIDTRNVIEEANIVMMCSDC